jgi:CBS domain-containing protein
MIAPGHTFLELTATDLMARNVVVLPQDTTVREAARVLRQEYISGAPVVDKHGRCVGVLSATDFLRLTWPGKERIEAANATGQCQFLRKAEQSDGSVKYMCTMAPGACLLQQPGNPSEEHPLCSLPNSAVVDWQMIEVEELPSTSIRSLMTDDPVTVSPETSIRDLARKMVDAHIHRVIVVDEFHRPVGVVSSTDILAAVARADE